jgi:hypothetical protein
MDGVCRGNGQHKQSDVESFNAMKTTSMNMRQILTILTAIVALLGATTRIQAASYTATVSGNWNATATWGGSGPPIAGDTATINAGVNVTLSAAAACATLTVNGTLTANNAITVSGNTQFTSTGVYACAATSGTRTFTGDVTLDAGSSWTSASAGPCSFGGNFINNATTFTGNGTYTFTGASKAFSGSTTTAMTAASISGSYANNGTLTVSGTLTLAGTLANDGALTINTTSGSGTLTQGTGATLTVTSGNSAISVTLVASASGNTVNYSGANPTPKVIAYQNLTISGSGNANWGAISTVNGNLTLGGTATINNFPATTVGGNLLINGAAVTCNTSGFQVTGTTTVTAGTLKLSGSGTVDASTFTGDFTVNGGTFNSNGGNPTFAGNFIYSSGTLTDASGSSTRRWTFTGSGKTIGSGTFTIPSTVFIANGASIQNNATLTLTSSGSNPFLTGSTTGIWTQGANSSLTVTANGITVPTLDCTTYTPNTVAYTSTSAQAVKANTYYNLTVSGASTKTLAGGVIVNNTLTISAGTLADGGNTLTANAGVVNNGVHSGVGRILLTGGAGSHSLSGTGTYQNLELNDANGASVAGGTSTISGTGTLILTSGQLGSSGGALSLANGATVSRAAGSLSLTPTFSTSVNVTYNDTNPTTTGSELPTSATVLNNLIINNAAGVTLNANATLKATLTLTSGKLITGANLLTVTSAGTISGGSSTSYVYGRLDRGFTTGSGKSATFPVGDSSVYAPVNLASATVTGAGDLVVSTAADVNSQGAFSSSGLSQTKYVNRDWTMTAANGYAQSAGSITFNFVAGDVQGAMSTSTDVVGKYSGGNWTKPTVASRTATSITVSGVTSFSDFVIGELPVPTFTGLSSKTISYGASSVSLSGTLSANSGTVYPVSTSTVTASINGYAVGSAFTDSTGDFTITYNHSSLATDGVGSSPYTITYSFAGDANLAAAASDTGTSLTVDKAALSITANNKSKTYGSALTLDGAVDFTPTGLQNGETVGSVTLTPSGGTATTDPVSGSPYTITPSAATGGTFNPDNYTAITYTDGTLTVDPLAVALTGSRAYDGTTNAEASILSVANAVGGDTVTVASGTGGLAGKNVPTQAITSFEALVLGNNADGNYTLTNASGSVTITSIGASVTGITANNKVYDGTNTASISVTNGVVFGGVVGADDVMLNTNSYSAEFAGAGVGTNLPVTVGGLILDGADAGNYMLTQPSGLTADITPAALTVTGILAGDRVYDGTTNAALDLSIVALAGVVDCDTNDVALDTNSVTGGFVDANVGTNKTVVLDGFAISGSAATNYSLTQPTATANIMPASLTIAANDKTRTFGLSNPVLTATYSGFIEGEDTNALSAQAILTTTADVGSAAGTYPITGTGAVAVNYEISYTEGTLTVVPQPELAEVSGNGDEFVFRFPTVAGESYQVENSTDLASGIWLPLGDVISGNGGLLSVTNLMTGSEGYFRLRIQQQ